MKEPINVDIEKILTPFSGDKPGGIAAQYESEYEAAAAEIAKLTAIEPSPVEWEVVVNNGLHVLEEQSKDLLIASYLTIALFHVKGYSGLDEGLNLYCGLFSEFWETMYPEMRRRRGRVSAVNWMMEKLEELVPAISPKMQDEQAVNSIAETLDKLNQVFIEKLADDAPIIRKLQQSIRGLVGDFEQKKAAKEKAEATKIANEAGKKDSNIQQTKPSETSNTPASSASSTSAPSTSSSTLKPLSPGADINAIMRQCHSLLKDAAAQTRATSLRNKLAYRLNRFASWIQMFEIPMNQDKVTQIPPLSSPQEMSMRFESLLSAGDCETLIQECESIVVSFPFFFEAHRYCVLAMDELGKPYEEAKNVVMAELNSFFSCFPQILDLKYSNKTPFVDDKTRLWIEQVVMAKQGGGVQLSIGDHSEFDTALTKIIQQAKSLAGGGKFAEGLSLFQGALMKCSSERERFFLRLRQALYCYESGYYDVAIPQLEFLDKQAQSLSLDQWEPDVCANVVNVLLLCLIKIMDKNTIVSGEITTKSELLFSRLCRLDLASALKIENKPWQKQG